MEDDHKKYFDKFLKVESETELFNYRVKGICVWDHLRYKVFYDFLFSEVRENEIKKKKEFRSLRLLSRLTIYTKGIFEFILLILKRKKYELVVLDDGNRKYLHGKYINNHLGPFTEHLSHSRSIIVLNASVERPVYKNHPSIDEINISFLFQIRKLASKFIFFKKSEDLFFDEIVNILNANFSGHVEKRTLKRDFIERSYFDYIFFTFVMNRLSSKKLILCDNGSCKGIYEAADRCSISVYDIQHSLMSRYNILYSYSKNVSKESVVMPSKILTYGEYWNDKYRTLAERIAVGSPFHEIKKNEVIGKSVPEAFSHFEKEKTMLIISSMRSGKKLEQIVISLADQLEDFNFIYKLRPNEYPFWKEVYSNEFVEHPRIFVIDTDEIGLYELFRVSSYQIGINSTAIIEGMTFNLKTFILKDSWYLEMLDFIEDGYVKLVVSDEEVITGINRDNFKLIHTQHLYLENSFVNLEKELQS
jgi:hypothetical protein